MAKAAFGVFKRAFFVESCVWRGLVVSGPVWGSPGRFFLWPDRVSGKDGRETNLIVLRNLLTLGPGKECGFGVFRGGGAFGQGLTS